ncbi:MAG: TIGR02206 family membrane protein [Planctomycetota bacterium]|nr:MAG: TIGR02206 family membrane protein [Planctomycetota bacterium]
MTGWLYEFRAFSAFHAVVAGLCVAVMALWCVVGRRLVRLDRADGGGRERAFGEATGWAIVLWQVFATVWRVLPGQWDLNESLPMHLCRWNGWIVAICLIAGHRNGWRWSRALTFFWGLGLSVQGIVTPMWTDGAATVEFWLYWVGHLQIVGVAVYDLVVRGYQPKRWDLRFAMAAGVGYVLLTALLNRWLGTNYSYLGSWDYERASIVDKLGDYPGRVFVMTFGALVLFIGMFWASRGVRALAGRRRAVPA